MSANLVCRADSGRCRPVGRLGQGGLTLVELLVSMTLSLVIVIAASAFFLNSGRTRDTQDEASQMQDNIRFTTDLITRNLQQAGFQNYMWASAGAVNRREVIPAADGEPDVRGYNDSAAAGSIDHGEHGRSTNRVNNSDTLVIRFQGSGASPGDGSMVDCLGRPQPEPLLAGDRAFSIFEVRQAAGAEPELRCKYFNSATGNYISEPIVRGVESLQFMYGVDTNADSFIDKWLNAAEVSPTVSTTALADWARVRSVRVGMVFRSPNRVAVPASSAASSVTLQPLGTNLSQSANDRLTVSSTDGRLRRVVTFTVNLRNAL
jgi:type IV pilus assembly protein PilW